MCELHDYYTTADKLVLSNVQKKKKWLTISVLLSVKSETEDWLMEMVTPQSSI